MSLKPLGQSRFIGKRSGLARLLVTQPLGHRVPLHRPLFPLGQHRSLIPNNLDLFNSEFEPISFDFNGRSHPSHNPALDRIPAPSSQPTPTPIQPKPGEPISETLQPKSSEVISEPHDSSIPVQPTDEKSALSSSGSEPFTVLPAIARKPLGHHNPLAHASALDSREGTTEAVNSPTEPPQVQAKAEFNQSDSNSSPATGASVDSSTVNLPSLQRKPEANLLTNSIAPTSKASPSSETEQATTNLIQTQQSADEIRSKQEDSPTPSSLTKALPASLSTPTSSSSTHVPARGDATPSIQSKSELQPSAALPIDSSPATPTSASSHSTFDSSNNSVLQKRQAQAQGSDRSASTLSQQSHPAIETPDSQPGVGSIQTKPGDNQPDQPSEASHSHQPSVAPSPDGNSTIQSKADSHPASAPINSPAENIIQPASQSGETANPTSSHSTPAQIPPPLIPAQAETQPSRNPSNLIHLPPVIPTQAGIQLSSNPSNLPQIASPATINPLGHSQPLGQGRLASIAQATDIASNSGAEATDSPTSSIQKKSTVGESGKHVPDTWSNLSELVGEHHSSTPTDRPPSPTTSVPSDTTSHTSTTPSSIQRAADGDAEQHLKKAISLQAPTQQNNQQISPLEEHQFELLAQRIYRLVRQRLANEQENEQNWSAGFPLWMSTVLVNHRPPSNKASPSPTVNSSTLTRQANQQNHSEALISRKLQQLTDEIYVLVRWRSAIEGERS